MLVAAFSLAGYLVGRCGVIDFYTMRYELLSLLGAAGLAGWFLRTERSRLVAAVWIACAARRSSRSQSRRTSRLIAEYADASAGRR